MYARLRGYFWLPCPLCGQEFGGHEWRYENSFGIIPSGKPGIGLAICPDCAVEKRNQK
jgi:hypothetical protein